MLPAVSAASGEPSEDQIRARERSFVMERHSTSQKVLATVVGAIILAASCNMNVISTGGWIVDGLPSSHALLVAALSLGVLAGARVIGAGAGKISFVIIAALLAGELFNLALTAERIVVEREAQAAPLKALAVKRSEAIAHLKDLETGKITSPRLDIANAALTEAKTAVIKEALNGGCFSICKLKQAQADKAAAEVKAAAQEAEKAREAQIREARAWVANNPLPPSATPLADRLGWPAWVIDVGMAALLSVGANGLAGVLIGYGAHSGSKKSLPSNAGQSDFGASEFDAKKLKAMVSGDIPPPPKPRKRKLRKLPANVVNFPNKPVVTALKNNGKPVSSNKELSILMGVSEAESSKRVKREKDYLDIVRVGKQTQIALKS